jgi:D-alanyl-D-alanine carboxypeptidase (penicillin-binding protein 5/6)
MKKLLTACLVAGTLLTGSAFAATAQKTASNSAPVPLANQQPSLIPSPPILNAKAYVLMDINNGTIIAEKNANVERAPASLTKLMTLYLTQRALANGVIGLKDKVLITKLAWQTGGSRMFLNPGTYVPLDLLTQGVIVDSGNDATMAIAQYVGGSIPTFVDMMNEAAKQLGMTHSHFMNPTGLPMKGHYSSAGDLAKLARTIWLEFPQYHYWFKQKWLTYDNIRQANRNRLLWDFKGTLGMKTGHTKEAGYCLISVAKRHGMTLLSVVMGTPIDPDRTTESIALLSYGFRFFNSHLLYQGGTPITKVRVWFGNKEHLPVGTAHNIYVTTPRGEFQNANVTMTLNKEIQAPLHKGQRVGTLNVTLHGKKIGSYPLIALANDSKGGFWSRTSDDISLKFHHWFGDSKSNTVKLALPAETTSNSTSSTNTSNAQ